MKKLILSFALILSSTAILAEGFQVNLQSTRQTGMGHTGTAMRLGAEGMHFNPASLVYVNKLDVSAGISGVFSNVKYNNNSYKAESDNKAGTPLFLYVGGSILKDRLAAGVSFTTPYGSSMNWSDHWAGANVVQNIALKSYFVQPTLSVKIVRGLSFGAGLVFAKGSFDLSRGLLPVGALAPFNPAYKDVTPLSVHLSGNSSIRTGYNLGLMYEASRKLSFGVSYRSQIKMQVSSGDAKLNYIDQAAAGIISQIPGVTIPPINNAKFSSELPLPSNLTFGIAYKPIEHLILAFDLQFTGWNAYDKLDIDFNESQLTPYNMSVKKGYENTVAYRLGAQYALCSKFDIRAGVYYDPTPVQTSHYNPETPGANKVGISAGASYRPCRRMSIDLAILYIDGAKTYGQYPTATAVNPTSPAFSGNYKSNAFAPSIGVGYSF